jgi:hypothetical protein
MFDLVNYVLFSLAIVFVLVVFLVYHFKTRISVAEQKTDTLFRLVSLITHKITHLFHEGEEHAPPTPHIVVVPKSQPEMVIDMTNNTMVDNQRTIVLPPVQQNVLAKRIVVSDMESDYGSDFETESDTDSSLEPESEPDLELETEPEIVLEMEPETVPEIVPETVPEIVAETVPEIVAETVPEIAPETEPQPVAEIAPEVVSIEQLKKMSVNQLKTMAIQRGVCENTTKLKKNELVQLLGSPPPF